MMRKILRSCSGWIAVCCIGSACNAVNQPTWTLDEATLIGVSPNTADKRLAEATLGLPEGFAGHYTMTDSVSKQPHQVLLLVHPGRWKDASADRLAAILGSDVERVRQAERRPAKWTFSQLFAASVEFKRRPAPNSGSVLTVDVDEQRNRVEVAVMSPADSQNIARELAHIRAPADLFTIVVGTPACTSDMRPVLRITVVDSSSGRALTSGAWAVLEAAPIRDSVGGSVAYPVEYLEVGAATGYKDGFTVRVGHLGYRDWHLVMGPPARDGCGYQTKRIVVPLQPIH